MARELGDLFDSAAIVPMSVQDRTEKTTQCHELYDVGPRSDREGINTRQYHPDHRVCQQKSALESDMITLGHANTKWKPVNHNADPSQNDPIQRRQDAWNSGAKTWRSGAAARTVRDNYRPSILRRSKEGVRNQVRSNRQD